VHHQTETICKLAVQQDGDALQFVHQQTEVICTLAVQQNGHALRFVQHQHQTAEICRLAIQQDSEAARFVREDVLTPSTSSTPSTSTLLARHYRHDYPVLERHSESILVTTINECMVCMQTDSNVITACHHQFCEPCLLTWAQAQEHTTITCPCCRTPLAFYHSLVLHVQL